MSVPLTTLQPDSESSLKSIDFFKEQKRKGNLRWCEFSMKFTLLQRAVCDLLISKTLVSNLSILVSPFAVHTVANKL